MALHYKVKSSIALVVLLVAVAIASFRHQPSLDPLASAFLEDAETGITILFPAGLDSGCYATLQSGAVTYRDVDGGSSDYRLLPEVGHGSYSLHDGKLKLHRDGLSESFEFELHEAPQKLKDKGVRFLLHGGGLFIGYAPVHFGNPQKARRSRED